MRRSYTRSSSRTLPMHLFFLLALCVGTAVAQQLKTNLTLPWGTWEGFPIEGNKNVSPEVFRF